jgi:hypothetical protein
MLCSEPTKRLAWGNLKKWYYIGVGCYKLTIKQRSAAALAVNLKGNMLPTTPRQKLEQFLLPN